MIDIIVRVLAGMPVSKVELHIVAWLVLVWFLMDLSQWLDWLITKLGG